MMLMTDQELKGMQELKVDLSLETGFFNHTDLSKPPSTSYMYVDGIPIVTFESIITNIEKENTVI